MIKIETDKFKLRPHNEKMTNQACFITLLTYLLLPLNSYASECVILLHGLARSDNSMLKLEKALKKANYHTVNTSYPSQKYTIDKLSSKTIPKSLKRCKEDQRINFVTHSMGGILVRHYLSEHTISNLNHVVMLGPPNKGSEVVDKLREIPGFKAINGPAGLQLGTEQKSIPNKLGEADFSLGIIAGTKTINPILSSMLPKPNDGKVSVESTKLEGMKDHISMPVTHTLMMRNKKVIDQVLHFLKSGQFDRATPLRSPFYEPITESS